MSKQPDSDGWEVVCLCAEWCGTCRDWRTPFEDAARAHPGASFAWVDIEDDAEAMGEVDVETFPTLLIAHRGKVRFLGPVLPQPAQFDRLLSSLRDDPHAGRIAEPAQAQALYERIRPIASRLI